MIPTDDYTKQKRIYTHCGQGLWKIVGYFDNPSLAMENIHTKERRAFAVNSLNAVDFEEVPNLIVGEGRELVTVLKTTPLDDKWVLIAACDGSHAGPRCNDPGCWIRSI